MEGEGCFPDCLGRPQPDRRRGLTPHYFISNVVPDYPLTGDAVAVPPMTGSSGDDISVRRCGTRLAASAICPTSPTCQKDEAYRTPEWKTPTSGTKGGGGVHCVLLFRLGSYAKTGWKLRPGTTERHGRQDHVMGIFAKAHFAAPRENWELFLALLTKIFGRVVCRHKPDAEWQTRCFNDVVIAAPLLTKALPSEHGEMPILVSTVQFCGSSQYGWRCCNCRPLSIPNLGRKGGTIVRTWANRPGSVLRLRT